MIKLWQRTRDWVKTLNLRGIFARKRLDELPVEPPVVALPSAPLLDDTWADIGAAHVERVVDTPVEPIVDTPVRVGPPPMIKMAVPDYIGGGRLGYLA